MKISKTITSGIAATAFVAAVSLAYAQSSDTPVAAPAADNMQTMQQQPTPATQPAMTPSSEAPATSTTPSATTPQAPSETTSTDTRAAPERAPQADRN